MESTGNTRFFRNKLLPAGIDVKVVNTLKFKVVNESVKKTDHYDARMLAEFLEKDMLPESILCSQESEDIRRVLKPRSISVKSLLSLKNQVYGLLLGYGIETKRGQLQSKKERQAVLNDLEDHDVYGSAARAVKPLLDTIDQIAEEEIRKDTWRTCERRRGCGAYSNDSRCWNDYSSNYPCVYG